ncbi:MAG: 2,3-bisphosphoglycerate-dependent phosphoglycerate mutase [Caulobacteraceae bacterium]|nr:2,3-bisphosphoglycerate-dependent phosphoglycerate mutase [Caulobacter sp.]
MPDSLIGRVDSVRRGEQSSHAQGRLLLVRHGESEFNSANLFTGWSDPPLTELGVSQATRVGERLAAASVAPHQVFSSGLQRAISSVGQILQALGIDPPVHPDLALNERDYGELTGLNKAEAQARFGGGQVRRWRRGYADAPPGGESLRDVIARALPFYLRRILPPLLRGETILVVSHGNTLRGLVMALQDVSPLDVQQLEIAVAEIIDFEVAPDATVSRTVV